MRSDRTFLGPEALSIIVPAKNEARSVIRVLTDLRMTFPGAEILLVDNASNDNTAALASSVSGVRIIHEVRPGKGHAMRKGAEEATGSLLLFHDADTEYEIADARDVVAQVASGARCVIGVRRVSFDKVRASSWLANWLIQFLLERRFHQRIRDVLSGTRCMRKQDFLDLQTRSAGFGIETEIAVKCLNRKFSIAYADVRYTPRSGKDGKKIRAYHLFALIRLALT